jgi:hypothetical protein
VKPVRIRIDLTPTEAWQVTAAAYRANATRAEFIRRALLAAAATTPRRPKDAEA